MKHRFPPLPLAGEGRGEGGATRRNAVALCTALIALTLLAACGKKGSPAPPGPTNEVVYPRSYPSR